jgi:hypothetical protein
MISQDRIDELEYYFYNESNDEDTQTWRDYLNKEEQELINKWDKQFSKGMINVCEEILKHSK